MKKHLYLCFIVAICVAQLAVTGCKTSVEDAAYKTAGAVNITANAAMQAWLDYKNTHPVPPEQVAQVKAAWDKFYTANQEAKLATIDFKNGTDTNGLPVALAAASAASSAVVSIILKLLPPASAASLAGGDK